MSEARGATVVATREETSRGTKLLLWAVVAALLVLVALVAYVWASGDWGAQTPRTAEEQSLALTASSILRNPKEGSAYAIRAETLFKLGRTAEAYQVLDQGERAVGKAEPALLYVLRTRTALLNQEGRYAEAEQAGLRAMAASDDYLGQQGQALANKQVTGINGNLQTQESVDTAIQLAAAYMGEKKYDKALELYNYAQRVEPLGADILDLRGACYLAKGDKASAKLDFQKALTYLPNDAAALHGLKLAND